MTARAVAGFLLALLAMLGVAQAQTSGATGVAKVEAVAPPISEPFLRIEAGMHTLAIKKLDLSADGKLMVTGADDKTARLWSMPDGKLLKTFRVPIGPEDDGKVYSVAISPDGKTIAAGGWDAYFRAFGKNNYVYLFDTATGAMTKRLGPIPNVIDDLAFSRDGTKLAVGAGGGFGVFVFTAPYDRPPQNDPGYQGEVYGMSFDTLGRLATVSYDKQIRLYDPKLELIAKVWTPNSNLPFSISFSPDGSKIAVGYNDKASVDIFSGQDLSYWYRADTSMVTSGDLLAVAWYPDGSKLAAGGRFMDGGFGPVIRWNGTGTDGRRSLGGPINTVMDLATNPTGGVVFGAADPAFGILDDYGNLRLYQGPVIADMRGKRGGHFWISPDGYKAWFGMKEWSGDPWLLDIQKLTFEAAPERPPGLIEPRIEGIDIKDWINATQPTIDAQVLALESYETARSLAITGDAKEFILGAEWSFYRFNAKGEQVYRKKTEGLNWGVALTGDDQVVVAAQSDGTIRWYRADNGQELLAFFVHVPTKRWIAWTPKGYYAASPGGEDLIGWHVNRSWDELPDFFPAAQFRHKFYRPDIVKLVLGTRDEDAAIKQANEITRHAAGEPEPETDVADVRAVLPPVVELTLDADEIETREAVVPVKYLLRSPSGKPIIGVDLLIDGRPLTTRGAKSVVEADEHTVNVPVPPRDSELSIIARTEDGASVPVTVKIKWLGARTDGPKPKLYAVVIGVSEYEDVGLKLNYADDDARAFAEQLIGQRDRYYSNVELKVLVDREATLDNILDALTWLEQSAGPDDYAMLFMAGHGVTDARQRFYFLPVGSDADPSTLKSTALSEGAIRDSISAIQGKVLFFIDACKSASALDGALGAVDVTAIVNDLASAENGIVMFSSSTGRELSLEDPAWGHGAFTLALLEGLRGEADYKKDGRLTTAEINLWLTTRVAELTGDRQNAVMVKPRTVKEFALALVQ